VSNTPHDHGPDRRAAHHVPLALRSAPENAAQICSRSPLATRHSLGYGLARPTFLLHPDGCRLPAASTAKIQKFVLRHPAKSSSAIE
jgi:hypothetical protein